MTALTHSTIVGPVGMRVTLLLVSAPLTPERAPKNAAVPVMTPIRSVH